MQDKHFEGFWILDREFGINKRREGRIIARKTRADGDYITVAWRTVIMSTKLGLATESQVTAQTIAVDEAMRRGWAVFADDWLLDSYVAGQLAT